MNDFLLKPTLNRLLKKKKEFNNLSIFWEYWVHKYIYFKHYWVYLWFFKHFGKQSFYKLVLFFNLIKLTRYRSLGVTLPLTNKNHIFKSLSNLGKHLSNTNVLLAFFRWKLFFFYQRWSIISFYYIPFQFQFNWAFLSSSIIVDKFISLYENTLVSLERELYFMKITASELITKIDEYKPTNIFLTFNLLHELRFLVSNWNYAFLNLDFFLKKNANLRKLLFSTEISFFSSDWFFFLKSSYHAFWSFLAINLYLTRSFYFQPTFARHFDVWTLKNFNEILFWTGMQYQDFSHDDYWHWSWWNIFFSAGSPYNWTYMSEHFNWSVLIFPNYFDVKYKQREQLLVQSAIKKRNNKVLVPCKFFSFNNFMVSVCNRYLFFT